MVVGDDVAVGAPDHAAAASGAELRLNEDGDDRRLGGADKLGDEVEGACSGSRFAVDLRGSGQLRDLARFG